MVQTSQDRATLLISRHSRVMVVVIAFSLFIDYFLYGVFFPLAAHSPAKLKSEEQFVLLYGAYAISILLVTPVFAYLGDRVGGRATVLCGLALLVCAVLLFGIGSTFSVLLIARLFQGAASAALWTAGLALIAAHYVEKRVEMLGYAFTSGTLGSVLGPVAGGTLQHAGGYRLPFLIIGVLALTAAGLVALFLPPKEPAPRQTLDIGALLSDRAMLAPALTVVLAAFSIGIVEPLLPVRLARYGASSMAIGLIFTISTIVYGLSAPVVGRVSERLPIQRVILLGTIAMAVVLPFLSLFKGAVTVCIVLSLANVSYAFMLNPASAELGNTADRAGMPCYSVVYGVYNICYSIGMLTTAGFASMAARRLGFWGVLLCVSAVLLLLVPFLSSTTQKRKIPATQTGN